MLTEAEAKTKWCPMHRIAVEDGQGVYGNMPNNGAMTCAGSGCMAWRWKLNDHGHSMGVGFCGLAGKP